MPQNIFNLYSSTVFADHPLALWNLDDDFSYLSLISASPVWNIVGGSSASVAIGPKTKPGETVGVSDSDITYQTFAGSSSAMTMKAQSFYSPGNLDLTKQSVCVSTFIYPYDNDVTSCEIGFEYIDPGTSQTIKKSKTYTSITEDQWKKIEYSTNLSLWSASASNVTIYPYLQITFSNSPITRKFSLYNFAVGQWSEQYNAETVGSITTPLSSLSASAGIIQSIGGIYSSSPSYIKTVPIDAYSLSDADTGYYIIEGNKMLATNSKLPMVYGSGNITEVYPSSFGTPSIIIPGKGFLHENGRYRNLTLEFWMRINVSTDIKTRVLGPIDSQDGLYVHNGYLTLRLGPYEQSYFVSQWYRPMLINILYTPQIIILSINGEDVIKINLSQRDIELPKSKLFNSDWIAFYATENTQPFEIDCIAIYPYISPNQLIKKKFVYAQGVGRSEDIIKKFGGRLTNIDFSFSNYTNNITYPDMNQWNSGFISNMNADSKFLSLPTYSLPEITYVGDNLSIFNIERLKRTWFGINIGGTWAKWAQTIWKTLSLSRESDPLFDSYFTQIDSNPVKHIYLKPNSTYSDIYGSISFKSINTINDKVKSIFGVFSINNDELANATSDPNIEELTVMHFKNYSTGDIFKIIINISNNKLIYKFNTTTIKEYALTITNNDLFFIAGINIDSLSSSYANTIKSFFSNPQNLSFNVGGYEKNMFTGKIYKVTFNNAFFTNIDTKNWFSEEGISLINSSPITTYNSEIIQYIGNYSLLFKETNGTMIMDIGSKGYWEDSIPLSTFASFIRNASGKTLYDLDMIQFNLDYPSPLFTSSNIAASDSSVSSYVSLKTYEDVSTTTYSNYTIIKELNNERVITFDNTTSNIDITKFRVVDGTIIFTPKDIIDFKDAYITVHLEIKTNALLTEPLVIKEMSLASLAFDEISLYSINSFTGSKMYPFSRQGMSYSTKIKNPFVIFKKSMPYLFLTGDSGIYSLPYSETDSSATEGFARGISFPINASKQINYELYGFHLWACYKKDESFISRKKFMAIKTNAIELRFYFEPTDNNQRAKISVYKVVPSGEEIYTDILMYQNGILLDTPYIYPMSWSLLTFSLSPTLVLDSEIGQLEIYDGLLVNNITIYEQNIENKVDDIFESHLGLSSIVAQDESTLFINSEGIDLYTDIKWTTFIGKPV